MRALAVSLFAMALALGTAGVARAAISEEAVWGQLEQLTDEMFGTSLSVVDMGLIYDVEVDGDDNVHVVATVYHPGFVQTIRLTSPVRQKILGMEGVGQVTVECVREPAWTPDRLSQKARDALGFQAGDPVEGSLHVRSDTRADLNAQSKDQRLLERDHLAMPADAWGPGGYPCGRSAARMAFGLAILQALPGPGTRWPRETE